MLLNQVVWSDGVRLVYVSFLSECIALIILKKWLMMFISNLTLLKSLKTATVSSKVGTKEDHECGKLRRIKVEGVGYITPQGL